MGYVIDKFLPKGKRYLGEKMWRGGFIYSSIYDGEIVTHFRLVQELGLTQEEDRRCSAEMLVDLAAWDLVSEGIATRTTLTGAKLADGSKDYCLRLTSKGKEEFQTSLSTETGRSSYAPN